MTGVVAITHTIEACSDRSIGLEHGWYDGLARIEYGGEALYM